MKLVINEPPKPQSRPRFNSYTKRAYESSDMTAYKKKISYEALKVFKSPIEKYKPLKISITFYMPIPKALSKVKKNTARLESDRWYVTKKPDIDNLAKAVLDALNGIAFFDDGQIVKLELEKFYSFNPRTEIFFKELNNGN